MAILDKEWMTDIIRELSKRRPVFYSEADFQFELAWELKANLPEDYQIRLEYPVNIADRRSYVDIVVINGDELIPIELKYKTRKSQYEIENEPRFNLKQQSAQDISRYLFWKDVYRIENLAKTPIDGRNKWGKGFAIFLTNDATFWLRDGDGTIFEMYSMAPGYKGPKELDWNYKDSDKLPDWINKYKKFKRTGAYEVQWVPYEPKDGTEPHIKKELQFVILQCMK